MLIETSAPRILHQASDPVAKTRILIADDDPRNLMALDAILAAPDREIVQARSGWEVLRRARQGDFSVIVLDMRMPDLDGLQVAARIKADQRTARIPIVFITAHDADELQIGSGHAAGAVDYVFKPINPRLLRAKIDILIDLYRKTEEVRRLAEQEKRLLLENLRIQRKSSLPSSGCATARSIKHLCCNRCRLHFTRQTVAPVCDDCASPTIASDVCRASPVRIS
jgi:CheY-like chemotaxis protein